MMRPKETLFMKLALGLALLVGWTSAYAIKDADSGVAAGVVRLAASMNEMALACKHMTPEAVENAKNKQKTAALTDWKISSAEYDKLYAQEAKDFQEKWAKGSAKKQKQSCDQLRKMTENAS